MGSSTGPSLLLVERTALWAVLLLLAWGGASCATVDDDDDDSAAGDDDDTTAGDDDDTGDDDDIGDDDTSACSIGPAGEFQTQMNVDGVSRSYELVVPDSAVAAMQGGRVPVLIGLHGAGDTGSNFIHATQLTATASSNGFVLLGPDGYNAGWFVQSNEGWPGADGNPDSLPNDIDFMLQMLDELKADYCIDSNALFAVGHSRGAGFTGLLATVSGQVTTALGPYESPFAAYAVNAGYDPYGGSLDFSTSSPKRPIWVIHGTGDSNVPYSYGEDFADDLDAAGWDATFTPVNGAGHTWLFQPGYSQDNQDLWDYFMANAY